MNDTCEEDEKEEFLPGDMLWTKFENYPFWPCMVTYDPIDGVYIKTPRKNGKTQKTYHVQFFGQDVERGWTIPENSIPFKGEKEYGERIKALKSKMNNFGYAAPKSRPLQDKYKVQKFHKKKWEKAVKEAEEALLCSNSKERFENYVFLYKNTKRKTSQGTKMQLNGDNNVFEQSEASISKKIRYSGSSHTVCDTCQETTAEFSCSGICKKSFHLGCVGLTITPVNFKCIECLSASGKPTKKMKAWLDPVYASSKNFDKIFPKNVYTELGQFQPLMQPLLKLHKVPHGTKMQLNGDNNVFEQSEASISKKIRYSGSSHTVCDTCQETTAEFSCSGICKKSFHLGCVGLTITPVNFKCIECLSASGKPTKKMKAWLDPVYASSKNFDKIFPKNVYTELGQFQPLMQPLLKLHKVPHDHQSHAGNVGGPFPLQITSERRDAAVNPNDHSKMKPSMKAPSLQSHGQSMQGIRSPSPREVCHRMPPNPMVKRQKGGPARMRKPLPKRKQDHQSHAGNVGGPFPLQITSERRDAAVNPNDHSKMKPSMKAPSLQSHGQSMQGIRSPSPREVCHRMPPNPMVKRQKGGPAKMRKPLPKRKQDHQSHAGNVGGPFPLQITSERRDAAVNPNDHSKMKPSMKAPSLQSHGQSMQGIRSPSPREVCHRMPPNPMVKRQKGGPAKMRKPLPKRKQDHQSHAGNVGGPFPLQITSERRDAAVNPNDHSKMKPSMKAPSLQSHGQSMQGIRNPSPREVCHRMPPNPMVKRQKGGPAKMRKPLPKRKQDHQSHAGNVGGPFPLQITSERRDAAVNPNDHSKMKPSMKAPSLQSHGQSMQGIRSPSPREVCHRMPPNPMVKRQKGGPAKMRKPLPKRKQDHQSHAGNVGGPFPLQITSERRGAAVNPNDHSKMKPSMKAPSLQSHGQSMQGIRSPSPREVCHRMPPVAVHSKKNSPPPSPQVQVVNGPPMTGSRGPPSGVVGHTMPPNPMVKGGPAIMRKPLPKWMQNHQSHAGNVGGPIPLQITSERRDAAVNPNDHSKMKPSMKAPSLQSHGQSMQGIRSPSPREVCHRMPPVAVHSKKNSPPPSPQVQVVNGPPMTGSRGPPSGVVGHTMPPNPMVKGGPAIMRKPLPKWMQNFLQTQILQTEADPRECNVQLREGMFKAEKNKVITAESAPPGKYEEVYRLVYCHPHHVVPYGLDIKKT